MGDRGRQAAHTDQSDISTHMCTDTSAPHTRKQVRTHSACPSGSTMVYRNGYMYKNQQYQYHTRPKIQKFKFKVLTHSACPSGSAMVYLHSPSVFHSLMVLSRLPVLI